MTKPHDIPQDIWDAVADVPGVGGGHEMRGYMQSVRENAARVVMRERAQFTDGLAVLKEILDALRADAPGTPLNNHKYDQLGIRAYAFLEKAGVQ